MVDWGMQGSFWAPVPFTSDETVDLCESHAVMMNVTVLEQAPQLQTGQQEGVVWGVGVAKSAVEAADRPQLSFLPQHHKLHLLHDDTQFQDNSAQNEDAGTGGLCVCVCEWVLTCLRSVSRFLSGILSRRQSMFRAMSGPSKDEPLSDRGNTPLTKYERILNCRIANFLIYYIKHTHKYCCFSPRGLGTPLPLELRAIIWSSTNSPSNTHLSLKVSLPYVPHSTDILIST